MQERILVIDDEESIRYTFREFLSNYGYDVATATGFDKGLTSVDEQAPGMIFVDIILGGRTGLELLAEVQARNINCPVVIITGSPSYETAAEAVRLGAFDYIPKPFELDMLLRVTHKALEYRRITAEREEYRANIEAMFESVNEAIVNVDSQYIIRALNGKAAGMLGLSASDAGRNIMEIQGGGLAECQKCLAVAIGERRHSKLLKARVPDDEGRARVLSVMASPVINTYGQFIGAVLVVRDESRIDLLERSLNERAEFNHMVGASASMRELYDITEDLAEVDSTVLILGESGTGKELVAEALHFAGPRKDSPLVKVNCSAIPETLLESELFGHVKGAFTGAIASRKGRFEAAEGGTIFLDEIGDISPAIQIRLLRVLQEKEFERVGGNETIKVNARIVAATNSNLERKVREGLFREDLYYRLNVAAINVPPLRERRGDIPLLVDHFMKKYSQKFNRSFIGLTDSANHALLNYSWPGNVRQLEHALESACIKTRSHTIDITNLPSDAMLPCSAPDERDRIVSAIKQFGGNKSKAAKSLGISRKTLYEKIRKYNIMSTRNDDPGMVGMDVQGL